MTEAIKDLPPVVSADEWKAAREAFLVKEKELTKAHDALAVERRALPRVEVSKDYRFIGPDGEASLLDLFQGRRQLIVYRHFFEPGVNGWPEAGCPGCSWVTDQMTHPAHFNARDTALALVSRAPQEDIERWKSRMGWEVLPWYTLTDEFDSDHEVGEWHGTNVFFRDEDDRIYRTYFTNGRGDELLGGLWGYLDITPLGRQEEWEDLPDGYPRDPTNAWLRRHDEYEASEEDAARIADEWKRQTDNYRETHGKSGEAS